MLLVANVGWLKSQAQDISFARPNLFHSISVQADRATRWTQGSYEILHLAGDVRIAQHQHRMSADSAIVWVELRDTEEPSLEQPPHKVIIYLEGRAIVMCLAVTPMHRTTKLSMSGGLAGCLLRGLSI